LGGLPKGAQTSPKGLPELPFSLVACSFGFEGRELEFERGEVGLYLLNPPLKE